ncbi:MAG: arginase family protein, partial [Candidatus Nitrosomaritimum aestuariumsis]
MSFLDLYMNKNPLITASDDDSEPVATIFGIPFDATHSYKPGCRFGPDSIRDSF